MRSVRAAWAPLGVLLADDSLVFSHPKRSPLLPNTLTHAWIKIARRAGFEDIRLHDAGHTHAAVMLKQGVASKLVQERLGHSTVAITLDVYSHVAPRIQEAAALCFDEMVAGRMSAQAGSSG